jgi:hypothetical protein
MAATKFHGSAIGSRKALFLRRERRFDVSVIYNLGLCECDNESERRLRLAARRNRRNQAHMLYAGITRRCFRHAKSRCRHPAQYKTNRTKEQGQRPGAQTAVSGAFLITRAQLVGSSVESFTNSAASNLPLAARPCVGHIRLMELWPSG